MCRRGIDGRSSCRNKPVEDSWWQQSTILFRSTFFLLGFDTSYSQVTNILLYSTLFWSIPPFFYQGYVSSVTRRGQYFWILSLLPQHLKSVARNRWHWTWLNSLHHLKYVRQWRTGSFEIRRIPWNYLINSQQVTFNTSLPEVTVAANSCCWLLGRITILYNTFFQHNRN